MSLAMQKRLAAQILKCSGHRVRFDTERLEQIQEAITKHDVRGLIAGGAIYEIPARGNSRRKARFVHKQRKKGRRRGFGKRKGSRNARQSQKRVWVNRIRAQKKLIRKLKENKIITQEMYKSMKMKAKGGFFRSLRHIKIYLSEQLKR